MKMLSFMFRQIHVAYFREKGKKEVYCLFAINIFTYLCSEYIKIENNDEEVYESDVAGLRMFAEPAGEGTTGYS